MNTTQDTSLLTPSEASIFLNVKMSRIRSLVFQKKIPFYKIGASIRFNKSELQKWLEQQKINFCNNS